MKLNVTRIILVIIPILLPVIAFAHEEEEAYQGPNPVLQQMAILPIVIVIMVAYSIWRNKKKKH